MLVMMVRGVSHDVNGVSYNPDGTIQNFKGYDMRRYDEER